MELLLLIIALLLSFIIIPIALVYALIKLFLKGTKKYFFSIAVSIDQTGGVVCQHLFNDLMVKPNGHRFGNEDETISSVLGKNKATGTLYGIGKALSWLLNAIDKNHVENSIEE